jgi:hypothetical protein
MRSFSTGSAAGLGSQDGSRPEANFRWAGFASSAAIYCAVASAAARRRPPRVEGRARESRVGSGSAARSVFGGFASGAAGADDGSDSIARPFSRSTSGISPSPSRSCPRRERRSRPGTPWAVARSRWLYRGGSTQEEDLANARRATPSATSTGSGDRRGELPSHARDLPGGATSRPLLPDRDRGCHRPSGSYVAGVSAYFTIDAGPQVKVLCRRESLAPPRRSRRCPASCGWCRPDPDRGPDDRGGGAVEVTTSAPGKVFPAGEYGCSSAGRRHRAVEARLGCRVRLGPGEGAFT